MQGSLRGREENAKPLWKTIRQFLIKCNICVLYDPAIPPLVTYPRKMSACSPRKTCTRISFIHNSSILETIQIFINRKIIYPYNGILNNYKNNQLIHTVTQMNLKNITISGKEYTLNYSIYIEFKNRQN